MDLGLAGKVAIVTGSSRGIGRGIAARLADEGADVVLCARGEDDLDAAVATIAGPGRAVGVVADVSTREGAAAVVEAAVEQFGGLDIVVNNVGGSGAQDVRRHGRATTCTPCSTGTSSRPSTSRGRRCPRSARVAAA